MLRVIEEGEAFGRSLAQALKEYKLESELEHEERQAERRRRASLRDPATLAAELMRLQLTMEATRRKYTATVTSDEATVSATIHHVVCP